LIYLLLGVTVGAAGFYFWNQYNVPEPVQNIPVEELTPRSNNIPASTLEELRWNVDKDPKAYLDARSASPRDAVDYYVLGRALFLNGEYWAAENQFKNVDRNMDKIEPRESANTIVAEINMMRAIMNDAQATENFKRMYEAAPKTAAADTSNSSAAGNSSVNENSNASAANSNP
jgi:hypothetical protein